jgi:hypothetical protein
MRSHNIFGDCKMNLIKLCSFPVERLTAYTMIVDYGGMYHSQNPEGLVMGASVVLRSVLPHHVTES